MSDGMLDSIRRHVSVTAAAIGLGGAWGSLAAIGAKLGLGIQETHAWLFVGLPVAVVVVLLMWKRLPRILGFDE
jgi:hypothetical protein